MRLLSSILFLSISLASAAFQEASSPPVDHEKPVIKNSDRNLKKSKAEKHKPGKGPSAGSASSDENYPTGQAKAEDRQNSSNDRVYSVNVVSQAVGPRDPWFVTYVVFTGIGMLIGLGTLGLLYRQTTSTKLAADAANKSATYLSNSERAWILVNRVAVTAGAIDRPEGPQQVFVQCEVQNNGRTPARVLEMRAIWKAGPRTDPGKTWDENLYSPTKHLATPRWVVLPDPKLRTALNCPIPGFTGATGQSLPKPDQAGEANFIHGVVRYWDMFSETNRFTRFCYRWDNAGGAGSLPEGFNRAGGDQYNQQT